MQRSLISPTRNGLLGKIGRTSAAGLVRRARELGLEVPANIDKGELRAFLEEAERKLAQGCDPPVVAGAFLSPANQSAPHSAASAPTAPAPAAAASSSSNGHQRGSVAELKSRLRELGFGIPSNIIEKSELRVLVEEAERLRGAVGCPISPSRSPDAHMHVRTLKAELPAPWRRKESRSRPGHFYYANALTGETTWEPWFRQELEHLCGRFFFVNVETGETCLEPPTRRWKDLCAAAPPPPPQGPVEAGSSSSHGPPPQLEEEEEEAQELQQEEADDPPEPHTVDYRDNAFPDGYHSPEACAEGGSLHSSRKPSEIASELPVACTQGDQGVKSLSVNAPADDWEGSPTQETIRGSHITWARGPLIGRGSLGRVFRARDQETGQILAVKEVPINRRDTQDEEFRASLENEVSIMKDLTHPHVVSYLGHDYIDGCLYMYLEHMAGGTLTQALNEFGPFEEFLIARYSWQLLQGLEYLHTREIPIIHRDIKGSNVLIGESNEVKLADFGCSKRTDETMTHTMRGSIPWMAPEVIAHSRYGRGADIWSFGCVQIEMGTANVPWGKFEHQMQALVRIGLSQETPPMPQGISALFEDFILQCVKRDCSERRSATELLSHDFLRSAAEND